MLYLSVLLVASASCCVLSCRAKRRNCVRCIRFPKTPWLVQQVVSAADPTVVASEPFMDTALRKLRIRFHGFMNGLPLGPGFEDPAILRDFPWPATMVVRFWAGTCCSVEPDGNDHAFNDFRPHVGRSSQSPDNKEGTLCVCVCLYHEHTHKAKYVLTRKISKNIVLIFSLCPNQNMYTSNLA